MLDGAEIKALVHNLMGQNKKQEHNQAIQEMKLHTRLVVKEYKKNNKQPKTHVRALILSHSDADTQQSVCLKVKKWKDTINAPFFFIITKSLRYTSGFET